MERNILQNYDFISDDKNHVMVHIIRNDLQIFRGIYRQSYSTYKSQGRQ